MRHDTPHGLLAGITLLVAVLILWAFVTWGPIGRWL